MEETLLVVVFFILRLGVPLAITLAVGAGLRRLDARWESQALAQREREPIPEAVKSLQPADQPCWEIKGCSRESRASCPACRFLDIPCWVARLRVTGRLPIECHNCELYSLVTA